MLSTRVHRDLTRYRAKVVGGLTARSLACTAAALLAGAAVGCWLTLVAGIGFEQASPAIYASTLPLWALGFWEPAGMRPERWLPLWLRAHGAGSRLTYGTRRRMDGAHGIDTTGTGGGQHVTKAYQTFCRRRRGVELWRPSEG